ncbi:Oxysterol-binding 1 [Sphaceloma murrayae]|uniref:Oxysterol-binding 1 n=1 Tax=Sphaceloma murrayae TaxID=2082308 RepID=A0A2K1QMJ4_9PEZI|nr:Oxysterol-binding 1 [Sphaceloma murrayae]
MSNGNPTNAPSHTVANNEDSIKDLSAGPRSSYEQASPNTGSARIRKKRSSANVQAVNRISAANSALDTASKTSLSVTSTPSKTNRKGSLRNAVRKLFGKKAKAAEEEVKTSPAKPPSRHGYTTSDPGALRPIPEQTTTPSAQGLSSPLNSHPPQRTLSAPLKLLDPPELRRARSPYAVEFPQSSRLKPLDLGNPFHRDQKEPKRRATLPSLIMDEREAAVLAKAIQVRSEDYNPDQFSGTMHPYDDSEIGLAVSTPTRKQHRRSRSADDLRRMAYSLQPVRERNEEIKYWRQSTAGSVLRHSVHSLEDRHGQIDEHRDVSPMSEHHANSSVVNKDDGDGVDIAKVSPMRDSPLMSRPTTAPQGSGDLEGRVTSLENGLATFQNALERLTAQSNRRTIIIDNAASPRGSRENTPSILVNSLLDADSYGREYLPVAEDPYANRRSRQETTPPTYRQRDEFQPSPSRTYTALYSIINHERNARRNLEHEVRALQQSLSDMQYQLSQPLIRRPTPSYLQRPVHPSQYGSQVAQYRDSNYVASANLDPNMAGQRLTSRFSLSDSLTDSEAARLRDARDNEGEDDTGKSFDLYQTPAEEQRRRSPQLVDGGMF